MRTILFFLLCCLVLGCGKGRTDEQPAPETPREQPRPLVAAHDLFHEFCHDENQAGQKYNGQRLLVTASVWRVLESDGQIIVQCAVDTDEGLVPDAVRLIFVGDRDKLTPLRKRERIEVEGTCRGRAGTAIRLENCRYVGKVNRGILSGRVTLKGQPLTEGRVTAYCQGMELPVSGQLGADGTYRLEGLAAGEVRLTVRGRGVPARFCDPATSQLVVEVDADSVRQSRPVDFPVHLD